MLTGSTNAVLPFKYCDIRVSNYFCTVCVAERCAGPFWYSYRISLNLPHFSTVYIHLLSHWSIILWPTLFRFYIVHYKMLLSLSSTFSWLFLLWGVFSHTSPLSVSVSLSLNNICTKCKWGAVPPFHHTNVHNVYFILLCSIEEESKWTVTFFLVHFIDSVYSLSSFCETDPRSRCSLK